MNLSSLGLPVIVAIAAIAGILILLIFISRFLKKVEPGKAMIVSSPFNHKGPKVSFSGGFVFPIIHKMQIMDISTKVLPVTRQGTDGLICKDNIRADITVHFYLRVNSNVEDVRTVATAIGCERASEKDTLNQLFQAKFSEALKTVGKQMDYAELFQERTRFKEEIIKTIGRDLNGYKLEDTAIDYLAQTPIEHLDANDIMDSEGIRKITELTSEQAIKTNEINQNKSETITKRNVEAKERILELEKQQAEAEARQKAEIEIIQAREQAQREVIVQEERQKSESARIATDEKVSVSEANKQREIEIALKNKERAIVVETEKIDKEKQLEITEKERVVAIAQIEKDKVLEEEKKKIQDIIRQRVAVERTVAEEEEKTKDIRAQAEADRGKVVQVTAAEAEAEQGFIMDIKKAEAKEKAAQHTAKEKETLAEAEKVTAVRLAEAKEILAKGIIAEESAKGLADVKVQEAEAEAIRLRGQAEAEKHRDMGKAEAEAMADKYAADAAGIKEKAESMKLYDSVGKEHEEFKLKLELQEKLQLAEINIRKETALAQSQVLSEALKSANIDIVGGESTFFEKLSSSIISGKSNGALIENNPVLMDLKDALLTPGSDGGTDLIGKIRDIIQKTGVSSETLKNLSIAAALNKLSASTSDNAVLSTIDQLKGMAKQYGIENLVLDLKKVIQAE